MATTIVSAYQAKTKQSEIFRRAAAGEAFMITNNGKPQVEIRQAKPDKLSIREAVNGLKQLHQSQLVKNHGGSHKALREMMEEGRD